MKGFTLIEVLIVVSIIAIITLFALNSYRGHQKKIAITTVQQALINRAGDIETFRLQGHAYNSSDVATKTSVATWKNIYSADNKSLIAEISYQSNNAATFTLTATGESTLLGDCYLMTINQLGDKTPMEKGCW